MRLWIDADAAPRDVKEIVYRAATRLKLETVRTVLGDSTAYHRAGLRQDIVG